MQLLHRVEESAVTCTLAQIPVSEKLLYSLSVLILNLVASSVLVSAVLALASFLIHIIARTSWRLLFLLLSFPLVFILSGAAVLTFKLSWSYPYIAWVTPFPLNEISVLLARSITGTLIIITYIMITSLPQTIVFFSKFFGFRTLSSLAYWSYRTPIVIEETWTTLQRSMDSKKAILKQHHQKEKRSDSLALLIYALKRRLENRATSIEIALKSRRYDESPYLMFIPMSRSKKKSFSILRFLMFMTIPSAALLIWILERVYHVV